MQKRLTAFHSFEVDGSLARSASGNRASNKLTGKIRQVVKWLDPKNWFSSLSNIEITMEEFACKKFVPEEKLLCQARISNHCCQNKISNSAKPFAGSGVIASPRVGQPG